jgi:FlaG/FlaF family flagellin (archaellin)
MKKIMNKKKGISTILAALLLVVIVVVASVIVYAWSTGLLGGLMPSSPSVKEGLSMDSYKWETGGTSVTLYLRNVGTVDITLANGYIEEAGQTKATVNVTDTIAVNSVAGVLITPSGFSWVSGHSYTIKLVTSRGTQFSFTVVKS